MQLIYMGPLSIHSQLVFFTVNNGMTFSHNYTAYVSVSVCVFVIMCIYLHVHPCVKNQNRGRWLLVVFAEWLLLISGSCGAQ